MQSHSKLRNHSDQELVALQMHQYMYQTYLHFQVDALVAQYGACMALLNETLASLELNANCGDCILETPQLATVQVKLSSIEGTEWIRGQEGADILLRQGPGDDLFLIWPPRF